MAEIFMFISYALGTAMGFYFARSKIKNIIGETIDSLIKQGYLRAERKSDGEYDIKKWNET
jgi:hypothetical protein|tara:strand:+ start:238 stop:420 length:183 start_codon:yes stop_codon:yes gene_type:complete